MLVITDKYVNQAETIPKEPFQSKRTGPHGLPTFGVGDKGTIQPCLDKQWHWHWSQFIHLRVFPFSELD